MPRILVIFPAMGSGTDPLYWGPLLSALAQRFDALRLLVCHPLDAHKLPGCEVPPPLSSLNFSRLKVPNLWRLYREIGSHGDVCVLNEFSPLSIASMFICVLLRRPRVLLVENHARFLAVRRGGLFVTLRRLMARAATVVMTNNKDGETYARETLHCPPEKLLVGPYLTSVLPAGSSVPASSTVAGSFSAASSASSCASCEEGARPKVLRMVALGRLVHRKGFDAVIDDLATLPQDVKRSVSLTIFGAGPEQDSLHAAINARGLNGQVRLAGHVAYAELGSHLAGFECFVMPTRGDYRSLSAFEALSQGFPLLMSVHDGAISEVLEDGVNGFAFDPQKPGDFAQALLKLRAGLAAGQDYRRASLARARSFTVARAVEMLSSAVNRAAATTDTHRQPA